MMVNSHYPQSIDQLSYQPSRSTRIRKKTVICLVIMVAMFAVFLLHNKNLRINFKKSENMEIDISSSTGKKIERLPVSADGKTPVSADGKTPVSADDIYLLQDGPVKSVDLLETQAKIPVKTTQTVDGKFFFVLGIYGQFYETGKYPFLCKFDEKYKKIWQYIAPEKCAAYSNFDSFASCAVDSSGNAFFSIIDEYYNIKTKKIAEDGRLVWERVKESTGAVSIRADSSIIFSGGLLLAGSKWGGRFGKSLSFTLRLCRKITRRNSMGKYMLSSHRSAIR